MTPSSTGSVTSDLPPGVTLEKTYNCAKHSAVAFAQEIHATLLAPPQYRFSNDYGFTEGEAMIENVIGCLKGLLKNQLGLDITIKADNVSSVSSMLSTYPSGVTFTLVLKDSGVKTSFYIHE